MSQFHRLQRNYIILIGSCSFNIRLFYYAQTLGNQVIEIILPLLRRRQKTKPKYRIIYVNKLLLYQDSASTKALRIPVTKFFTIQLAKEHTKAGGACGRTSIRQRIIFLWVIESNRKLAVSEAYAFHMTFLFLHYGIIKK